MSPVPDLTDPRYEFAPASLSGRYGVSVRAVAVHDASRGRLRVVPRRVTPPLVLNRRLYWVNSPKARVRQRFNNDRRLIRLKFVMLGAIGLLAMFLEVP